MDIVLTAEQVEAMVDHVGAHVARSGCDHSRRFTRAWAERHGVSWAALEDALDASRGYCDCEVTCNTPEAAPLVAPPTAPPGPASDPWMLPPTFKPAGDEPVSRVLVANPDAQHTHARAGEWLVPGLPGSRPRKRVPARRHFFVGLDSGLPAQVGFVQTIEPMALGRFVELVAAKVPDLAGFDRRVAAFLQARLRTLPLGAAAGTDIADRVDIARSYRELTVHRVIMRDPR
jgi:hypothetical protein